MRYRLIKQLFNFEKRFFFLIVLLLSINGLKAQIAVKTNVVIPIARLVDKKNFGGGFDISLDKKVLPKNVLRVSIYHNKQIFQNTEPDFSHSGSTGFFDYINKDGFRIALKNYIKQRDEISIPYGFYWGVFTDIMYARREIIRKVWEQGVGYSETNSLYVKGLFWGGGFNTGYTFKFKHLIIEPNLGIGLCFSQGKFAVGYNDAFSYGLDGLKLNISVCHLELHIGYAF